MEFCDTLRELNIQKNRRKDNSQQYIFHSLTKSSQDKLKFVLNNSENFIACLFYLRLIHLLEEKIGVQFRGPGGSSFVDILRLSNG